MHSDFGTTKIKICHSFPCVWIYLISNTLAISCEELTQWKRLWCWEGLGAGGEGDDRGWDGWMASLTRWMWVWVNSRSWWWTGSLACCNAWGHKELDMTEWLNWTELKRQRKMHQGSSWAGEGLLNMSSRCGAIKGRSPFRKAQLNTPPYNVTLLGTWVPTCLEALDVAIKMVFCHFIWTFLNTWVVF